VTELVWKDPPEDRRGAVLRASKYLAVAEQLRAHEGQWALLMELAWASNQTAIRKKLGAGFEVVTRLRDGFTPQRKSYDIYARFVGSAPSGTDEKSA